MTGRPILLVEDSQDDRELAVLALREAKLDCPVDVVRDGQETLDYLFQNAGPARALPRLVLLDLMLPKITGFEVLRRIRAATLTRLLPVVVLSSSDAHQDVVQAFELGANSYVKKPIEFTKYSEVVRDLGQYWAHINESV